MKSFRSFEPYSIKDWLIIPWFALRYAWYWIIWQLMISTRLIWRKRGFYFGRHHDPRPVWCERCMWTGPIRDLWHGYSEDECVDECPRCGLQM
jgi:hypothetical protein